MLRRRRPSSSGFLASETDELGRGQWRARCPAEHPASPRDVNARALRALSGREPSVTCGLT